MSTDFRSSRVELSLSENVMCMANGCTPSSAQLQKYQDGTLDAKLMSDQDRKSSHLDVKDGARNGMASVV